MSWDVAVVGGGLGGAAAASRLALAGRRVVLFEREHGRHDKVCGEFLSGDAAAELAELDVRLDRLGAMPIERVRVVSGRIEAAATLPFPAWGLSRRVLDDRLLRQAAGHGADVRRGTVVRALEVDGGGVRLQCSDGVATAAVKILASGKHDQRGWRRPGASMLIGLKLHLRLDETQRRRWPGMSSWRCSMPAMPACCSSRTAWPTCASSCRPTGGMAMALHSARRAAEAILGGHAATLYHRELVAKLRAPVRLAGTVAAVAAAPIAR